MTAAVSTVRRTVLTIAGIVLVPILASAQTGDTIRIGREIKTTIGTVTSLESGDVACYISLEDDRGFPFDELAEFEICDLDIVGKRVQLTYGTGRVMADECEGDPECTETRNVALVRSVRIIGPKAAPKAAPRPTPAPAAAPTKPPSRAASWQSSFCTASENVVFSCKTGSKLVSVCVSKDASRSRGALHYRYGKPASREPLEIILPGTPSTPRIAATGQNVTFSGGGGSWLRFKSGIYSYVIYSGIGRWGRNGETIEKQGVAIERSGKLASTLPCTADYISNLGPEWFQQFGVESKGEAFYFPN